VRLALITVIAFASATSAVDLPVFVVTVAVAHIALLGWELPSVGLTLGAPGLKPRPLPKKEQG